ncbi:MAG: gliding motility-associated C-terminal domain-containing protein, partial [Bacteroidota bacterium]
IQHPQPQINLGNDTVACTEGSITLNAGPGFQSYLWSNGSTHQLILPQTTDTYYVQVTDTNGCTASDTVTVAFHGPQFSLGNDTTVCIGDSVLLNPGSIYKSYFWSNGTFDSLNMVYSAGTYSVTVFDFQGCYASDTIVVSVSQPEVDLGNDTLLCGTINYILNAGGGFAQYHWSTNSTNSTLPISVTGTYAVSVTDQIGCKAADTVNIFNSDPHIELGNDTTICIHTSTELSAPSGFDYYKWNNGNTSAEITVTADGFYSVTVTDTFGCEAADSKNILMDDPKVFIGNDTSNCNGAGIVFDAGGNFTNYLWNDNSVQSNIVSTDAGIYCVTVTDVFGCTANDTAIISYNDCVEIDVPTAFSPNGDGHNDFFHILNSFHFKSGEIKIYNRWGELVYETRDTNGYWNGKFNGADCVAGVYVFVIIGKNFLDHAVMKTGNVTLIR